MKNPDGGYRLPEEIDPQRIQFCIEIPNELHHIIAFWGALTELTKWWNWERDDAHTALLVTDVWEDVIKKARASFIAGDCISPEICQFYRPTSPRIAWHPESPFNPNPDVPDGYTYHPWTVVDNSILGTIIGIWGFGYRVGDVYTDLTKLPIGSFEPIITWEFFPRFEVLNLSGTGTVKLHLLNIPQGGRLFIVKDGVIDLLNLQMIELNKDLGSIPAETQVPIVVEIEFTTDIDHTLQCAFLPTVDEALIPIFFGGGLRGIELCGFGRTGCDCMDEECCNKIVTRQDEQLKRFDRIISLIENGFVIMPRGSDLPPDAISFGECAPDKYDSDDGDEGDDIALRTAALCYVIHCYVAEILYKACFQMGLPEIFLNSIFPEHATMPDALHRIKVEYPTQIPLLALIEDIALNGAFSDLVACQMLIALRGQLNVFSVFKDSVSIFGLVGSITIPISGLVHASNQNPANWKVFGEALDQAMEMETEVDAYTCPCVLDCSEPLDLVIFDGHGTLELVDGYTDLYHFTGDAAIDGEGGVWVKDALGRCLSVWNSSVVELPTQAVLYHHVTGCCGTESTTGLLGGFAGLTEDTTFFTQFYWDQQTGPVDTYYHVKCIDECPEE